MILTYSYINKVDSAEPLNAVASTVPLQGAPHDFTVKTKEMEILAKKKLQGGGGEGKETQ